MSLAAHRPMYLKYNLVLRAAALSSGMRYSVPPASAGGEEGRSSLSTSSAALPIKLMLQRQFDEKCAGNKYATCRHLLTPTHFLTHSRTHLLTHARTHARTH